MTTPALIYWPEVRSLMGLDGQIANRKTGQPISEQSKKSRFAKIRQSSGIKTLPGGGWSRAAVQKAFGA